MPYRDLGVAEILDYAERIPKRQEWVELHDYADQVHQLLDGQDDIAIPESHRKLLWRGENHEGSQALNKRVRQFAAWLSGGKSRFSVAGSGTDDDIQSKVAIQERFARSGERELSKGPALHNWKHEANRDFATVGFSVVQQNPRKEFYTKAIKTPSLMAGGALLRDVIWRRRVDPRTFAAVEDENGDMGLVTVRAEHPLGVLAQDVGVDEAARIAGYFDFGEGFDPSRPSSWPEQGHITTVELWWENGGALVAIDGPGASRNFKRLRDGRILAQWRNTAGRPPFYVRATPRPYTSPLDGMIQLTNERNYWATMLDLQASGAIFRHWQLVEEASGDPIELERDAIPEHVIYDLSEPPPNMGPGTSWVLAPFEFHDVTQRYDQIRAEHENAGASVARLVGEAVNQNTPVGTADFMDAAALREFVEPVENIEGATEQMWEDFFRWHRRFHKDPLVVKDQQRDTTSPRRSFLNTTLELRGDDVVSEAVTVTLDLRSRLSEIADYRLAVEAMNNGHMDFDRAVEQGFVPGVDDATAEKAALFVSEGEKIVARAELMAIQQTAMQNAGVGAEPAEPNFLAGGRTDPRGTGTEQGPNNASNTALAAGSSDIAGRAG